MHISNQSVLDDYRFIEALWMLFVQCGVKLEVLCNVITALNMIVFTKQ